MQDVLDTRAAGWTRKVTGLGAGWRGIINELFLSKVQRKNHEKSANLMENTLNGYSNYEVLMFPGKISSIKPDGFLTDKSVNFSSRFCWLASNTLGTVLLEADLTKHLIGTTLQHLQTFDLVSNASMFRSWMLTLVLGWINSMIRHVSIPNVMDDDNPHCIYIYIYCMLYIYIIHIYYIYMLHTHTYIYVTHIYICYIYMLLCYIYII